MLTFLLLRKSQRHLFQLYSLLKRFTKIELDCLRILARYMLRWYKLTGALHNTWVLQRTTSSCLALMNPRVKKTQIHALERVSKCSRDVIVHAVHAYDFSTETAQRAMDHAYDKGKKTSIVPAWLNMPCVTRSYGLKQYKAREGWAGTWWNHPSPTQTNTHTQHIRDMFVFIFSVIWISLRLSLTLYSANF